MTDDAEIDLGAALKTTKKKSDKKKDAVSSIDDFLDKKAKKEKKSKKEDGSKALDGYDDTEREVLGLDADVAKPPTLSSQEDLATAKKMLTTTRVVAVNASAEEKQFDWKKVKGEIDAKAPPPTEDVVAAPQGKFVARGKGADGDAPRIDASAFASLDDVYNNPSQPATAGPSSAGASSPPATTSTTTGTAQGSSKPVAAAPATSSPTADGAPGKYVPGALRGGATVGPMKLPPQERSEDKPQQAKYVPGGFKASPATSKPPPQPTAAATPAEASPPTAAPASTGKYVPGTMRSTAGSSEASAPASAPVVASSTTPNVDEKPKYVPGALKTGAPSAKPPPTTAENTPATSTSASTGNKYVPGALKGTTGGSGSAPQGSAGAYRPGAMRQQQ